MALHTLGTPANAWFVNEISADITYASFEPYPMTLETHTKMLRLDLAKRSLIIIDMQNDFCDSDGWLSHIGVDIMPAQQPIIPLQRLLTQLRLFQVPILWVNWGNRSDLLNIGAALHHVYNLTGIRVGLGDPLLSNQAPVLLRGNWAAAVVDELKSVPGDIQIDKYRMSGFWDASLDSILRNLGLTTLFGDGVNADQCVMATLYGLNSLGYDCILLEDCTATTSPDYCWQATIYNVSQRFGFVSYSHLCWVKTRARIVSMKTIYLLSMLLSRLFPFSSSSFQHSH